MDRIEGNTFEGFFLDKGQIKRYTITRIMYPIVELLRY